MIKNIFVILLTGTICISCSLFSKKTDFDIPNKQDIEKMKEDAMKEVNQNTGLDKDKRERLKKEGKRSSATIKKVEDLNVTINKNPKVRIYLKVTPKDEKAFDAAIEMVVSRVNIPRAGDDATVFYNPNDKTDIIIE